jgi:hypothetical protein
VETATPKAEESTDAEEASATEEKEANDGR